MFTNLIPKDPKITIDRDAAGKAIRYCVDAATEQTLQQHRKLAMIAAGVLVFAAWKMQAPWWMRLGVGGIGVMMYQAHSHSRQAVITAEKLN